MFVVKIQIYILVCVTRQDLTDLTEGLSGNDDLSVLIRIAQLHVSDRDPVSVESDHSEPVVPDLEKFACHHSAALISGDGKDRSADQVS